MYGQGDELSQFPRKLLTFCGSDDDSDNESSLQVQTYFMNEVGLVESALVELTHEHQLGVRVCWISSS